MIERSSSRTALVGHFAEPDSTPHQQYRWHVEPSPHDVARLTPLHDEDHPCLEPGSYLPTNCQARWILALTLYGAH